MASQGRNNTVQQTSHGLHFSSRTSRPLNPSAGNFTSGPPEVRRVPPSQPRNFQPRLWGPGQQNHGHTTGPGGQARGERSRGRGQGQQDMKAHPQIPTQPAHQGAQQGQHHSQTQPPTMMQGMLSPLFPPPLYPQDGGQGYQPMFPMVHFPPPTPVYVGFPVMAHPIPPPIHQFPQQPHPGGTKAPGNQRPELQQADSHNVSSLISIRYYLSWSLRHANSLQSPPL